MDIKVNMKIGEEVIGKINEFTKATGDSPTVIKLDSERYRDLWIMTYYTQTRAVNKPHTLTHYCGCLLEICLDEGIFCS